MRKAKMYNFPQSRVERKKILKAKQSPLLLPVKIAKRLTTIALVIVFTVFVVQNYPLLTTQNIGNFIDYISFSLTSDDTALSKIPFSSNSERNVEVFGGGIVVSSDDTISLLNPGGYSYMSDVLPYEGGEIMTTANRVYSYKSGGTSMQIYTTLGKLYDIQSDYQITSIAVSDSGYAIVSDEKGYKSAVKVYDNNRNEKFKWFSSEYYILNVTISENLDKMVANVFFYDETISDIGSRILLFSFGEEEVQKQLDLQSEIATHVHYFDNGRILVLTNENIYVLNSSLEIISETPYDSDELISFSVSPTNVAVATRTFGQSARANITIVDDDGDVEQHLYSETISDISICPTGIAVLSSNKGAYYNLDMENIWQREDLASARNIVLSDAGEAYAIFSDYCEIILPVKSETSSENNTID